MEDLSNGRSLKWKISQMEDPKRKISQMEDPKLKIGIGEMTLARPQNGKVEKETGTVLQMFHYP